MVIPPTSMWFARLHTRGPMANMSQIAFQTAVALAVYDARQKNRPPVLRESHLKQVVTMSAAFKEYIISTHEGMEDAQIAYRKGLRDDTLGSAANSRDSRGQAHITRRRNWGSSVFRSNGIVPLFLGIITEHSRFRIAWIIAYIGSEYTFCK